MEHMETKNKVLNRYSGRIIFPVARAGRRSAPTHPLDIEDYILSAKRRKKERVSEMVRETLYEKR